MKQKIKELFFGSYFRLAALCVGLAVLPLFFMLVYNEAADYNEQVNVYIQSAHEAALDISAQQHNAKESITVMLQGLQYTQAVREKNYIECTKLFYRTINSHAAISAITLYDNTGIPLVTAGHEGYVPPLKERASNISLETIISDDVIVSTNRALQEMLLILPLRNEAGGVEQFLTVSIWLEYFAKLMQNSTPGQASLTAIYNHTSNLLYFESSNLADETLQANELSIMQYLPKEQAGAMRVKMDSADYFIIFTRLSSDEMAEPYLTTALISPYKLTFAATYERARRNIGLMFVAFGLSLFITVFASVILFKLPVARLLSISSQIGRGNFAARQTLARSGAFASYSAALFEMAGHLEKREEDLKHTREQAETASKVKGEFLANISHEIRTPMNGILGMSYLAAKSDLTPVQQSYITKVQAAGQSLLHIIDDILDFSKMETGKLSMEHVRFAIRDLFTSISSNYRKQMEEQEISLTIDVAPNIPLYLTGDPMRLEQAITQLVDNAMRHTKKGTVRISCSLIGIARNDCALRIVVADTGEGMRPDFITLLNHALGSGDINFQHWNEQSFGQGLGLPIAHKLFKLMNGSMQVTSELGRGTVFTCTAHFDFDEANQGRGTHVLTDRRVLIFDTDSSILALQTSLLTGFSMQTRAVGQIQAALSELAAADSIGLPYDFFILDWRNADMELSTVISHIKQSMPLKQAPKIVVTSAFGRDEMRRLAETAGADSFLHKPVHGSVLLDTLMDLCGATYDLAYKRNSNADIAPLKGLNILLVEDNPANRQIATDLLEDAGIKLKHAINGREALKRLEEAQHEDAVPFDLILMDLQMPEMDGFEATWRIRKDVHLNFTAIPIIAMTAHRSSDEIEACRKAGMDDHIPKPIDVQHLFSTLNRWLPVKPDTHNALQLFWPHFEQLLEEKQAAAGTLLLEWRSRMRPFTGDGRIDKMQHMLKNGQYENLYQFVRILRKELEGGNA
ncbi:response regulator [Desulfovibrio sp. OttesenSCG-928-F07]|nr:response regulator [Desulfovibrio sp. OttesenSCG-928-F07]